MRTRPSKLFILAAPAAALVLCAPLAASGPANAATAEAKLRPSAYQFLLTFDNRESLRAGTRVVDASGHRHAAVVMVDDGGRVTAKPGVVRRGAQFPHRGRAILQIADRKSLDPRTRDFIFGASVRVGSGQGANGSNLVQKGYYNQRGGQYKLQLAAGGVPVCVVFGSGGRVKAVAKRGVANGHWHRVACARTSNRVTVWIDGKRAGTGDGATGRIANDAPVKIAGKKTKPANKQFRGRVDNVYMRIVRSGS